MPGPDGFTVAGQIRAAGSAPILVVSGESAEAAKVKALGIGADDYLVKPFGKAELLARIAAVMRRVDRAAGAATSGSADRGRARPGAGPSRGARRRRRRSSSRRPSSACSRRSSAPPATSSRITCWRGPAGRPRPDPDLLWLKPHLARLRAKVEGAGGPRILAVRGVGYRIDAESGAPVPAAE